ncbi:uracil DNA glycosylase [Streptococcus pneumoniae]|nr:uracil DNA glycosylase [Streptococcus pneumoniae]
MSQIERIKQAIMADSQNASYTERGIEPLFAAPKTARINIIGQAPGLKTQEAGLYWKDKSGDRLRDWLGVDEDTFYNSGYFAVLPMDFYFPGHGKSGDLPPRTGFAEKWHPQLLQELPDIQLTLLIGQYAQAYYLQEKISGKVTERVKHYKDYLPAYFPLVHPSPRNQIWMAKNPWFEAEVVPDLKKRIKTILYSMKIKEQTRKLVVGCSKYRFEVADKTDEVGNIRTVRRR